MCFLCTISQWSRRVASMLPWFVIPLIAAWAFSQLLPPSYHLEITSSRLACLGVLLLSLVWYELLMPWLSSWRAHRRALLKERKLIEALEASKLRKEATRRCRNCLTVYKLQMPGSGKYVCTYCGHVSRRPVLEVAGTLANSRLATQGSAVRNNSAVMSYLRIFCQGNGPLTAWYRAFERNWCSWFGESLHLAENCSPGQSFPAFISKAWLFICEKVLGIETLATGGCPNLHGESENMDDASRSRLEKARRKAHKKKQARSQKELLEAEDRKQREEMTVLVEERRRRRGELEILQQKEREASTRKGRESRGGHIDKGIEKSTRKVGKSNTSGQSDQGQEHIAGTVQKFVKNVGDNLADLGGSSKEQVDGLITTSKSSQGTVQDQVLKYRSTMESNSRLGFLKRSGNTVQKASASAPKASASPQSDGFLRSKKDSADVGKWTILNGSSSSRSRIAGATDSGWKRAPWISAWAKGSKGLAGDSDKTQEDAFSNSGKRLEQDSDMLSKSSNYVSLINKPSLSPVPGTAIQPPIAPPSLHADPLQQLFSTPSLFSPMNLCANIHFSAEQKLQNETKHVFLPQHTFFEAQSFPQMNDSFGGCPAHILDTKLSLPQSALQGLGNSSQPNSIPQCSVLPNAAYNGQPAYAAGPAIQMVSDTKLSMPQPALQGFGSSSAQLNVIPECAVLPDTSYNGQPAYASGSIPPFDVSHVFNVAETKDTPAQLSSSSSVKEDNTLSWENAHEKVLQLPPLNTVKALFGTDFFTSDSFLLSPLERQATPR